MLYKTQPRHLVLFRSLQRAALPLWWKSPTFPLLFIKILKIRQNSSIPFFPFCCDPPLRDEGSPKVPKLSDQAGDKKKKSFFFFLDPFVLCVAWSVNKKNHGFRGKIITLSCECRTWDFIKHPETYSKMMRFGSCSWSTYKDSSERAKITGNMAVWAIYAIYWGSNPPATIRTTFQDHCLLLESLLPHRPWRVNHQQRHTWLATLQPTQHHATNPDDGRRLGEDGEGWCAHEAQRRK